MTAVVFIESFRVGLNEADDESLPYVIGVGSLSTHTTVKAEDAVPKEKNPIGFIWPKKKNVRFKSSSKDSPKGKRTTKKGAPSKRANNKRAVRPVRKQSGARAPRVK